MKPSILMRIYIHEATRPQFKQDLAEVLQDFAKQWEKYRIKNPTQQIAKSIEAFSKLYVEEK